MKTNILRKSYFFSKHVSRRFTRLYNLNKKPYKKKKNPQKYNSLFCRMRPNNTFITYTGESKLHVITAGTSGFQGPKRSSPYSRYVVARNMSYYIFKNKMVNPFDIYFNSRITRKFFFFFQRFGD